MAEGRVERISQSLDSISLSSNPEERDALEEALNLDENHAMLPDDMIRKVKRLEDEKQRQPKQNCEEKIRDRHKDKREHRETKREETEHKKYLDKERRKREKREGRHCSQEKHETSRKRHRTQAEEKTRTCSYSPQERKKTGITYDFL